MEEKTNGKEGQTEALNGQEIITVEEAQDLKLYREAVFVKAGYWDTEYRVTKIVPKMNIAGSFFYDLYGRTDVPNSEELLGKYYGQDKLYTKGEVVK